MPLLAYDRCCEVTFVSEARFAELGAALYLRLDKRKTFVQKGLENVFLDFFRFERRVNLRSRELCVDMCAYRRLAGFDFVFFWKIL